jgi:poly-gamma-glutamate capsule biosynthesis protein CapA/YwtB (metallophosphatase superfamily)
MYFPRFDAASGRMWRLTLAPTRVRRFRLNRASENDTAWLAATLNREGQKLGTRVEAYPGNMPGSHALAVRWSSRGP